MHCHPRPLGTRRKRKLLFFEVLGTEQKGNKRFSTRPSSEEQDPETPSRPSQGRRASRAWQGQRRAAPLSCGQLHAVAVVKAAAVAELERRWRQQEGALGDEQTEWLQPAVGWRQQQTAGAGCVETPPSASVRWRTVGQSPPPLCQIGRPGRSGSPRSDACQPPSYPPSRSAIQCPPLILAPLVNMSKGSCENKSALFILFIFH